MLLTKWFSKWLIALELDLVKTNLVNLDLFLLFLLGSYEKLVGGAFLGEYLRRILLDLTEQRLILNGQVTQQLATPSTVATSWMSLIEQEWLDSKGKPSYEQASRLLREVLGYEKEGSFTTADLATVSFASQVLSNRCALLCAVCK